MEQVDCIKEEPSSFSDYPEPKKHLSKVKEIKNEIHEEEQMRLRLLMCYDALIQRNTTPFYGPDDNTDDQERCPILTRSCNSRQELICEAERVYLESSRRIKAICGSTYPAPCIIRLGGEIASSEFYRLCPKGKGGFRSDRSFWLPDTELADLDSTLCMVVNKLAQLSQDHVRCWWDDHKLFFVLFTPPLMNLDEISLQKKEEDLETTSDVCDESLEDNPWVGVHLTKKGDVTSVLNPESD